MKLFDLSLRLNGFPLGKAKTVFSKITRQDENDYENYLIERKTAIVDYHLTHNNFYKSFVKNSNTSNWNDIPILTKHDLQQPLSKRLSNGFNKNNVYVNKTSGSSGNPFIFAKDKFCHALTWCSFIDRYEWFGLDFNRSKQARFYGIPLNKKGYYKERFKDVLSKRFRFSVFDLSNAELAKNLKIFKSTRFEYINGYTSAIVQFAKFLEQENTVLKTVCPSLKGCIVTSEMLFEADRKLLEKQFNIPIINEYGAAELGLIAFQNPNGTWQINTEDLFIEILDNQNKPLPYGEEGRIIITSLYNKAHPFIRYELGDIGVLSKQSTISKPILEKLTGRTSDLAILPSGKKAAGLTFYYITKTVIEDKANVKEFIVEQVRIDTFNIKYVSSEALSIEKIKAINEAIDRYLEPGLIITFEQLEEIKRSKSGKLKQFKSFISHAISK